MAAKRIGYVDYRLDNYHANTYLDLLRNDWKWRGWEVAKAWALDGKEGRKWSAAKGVAYARTVAEMSDCDALMVLAPSNPETHLGLAELALPLGKPTYIDKTFAPDHATAKRIFALADRHGAPVITMSALRCAASLNALAGQLGKSKVRHMRAWGPGRSFEEYVIHPLEMVIATMGPEVKKVLHLADGANHHELHLVFAGGRSASVFVHANSDCAFQAMLSTDEKTTYVNCAADPIFRDLCGSVLDFFDSGKESVDRKESLAIFKVLDVALGKKPAGRFVEV